MDSRVDSFEIAGRQVGADAPLFVMAEIGLNHDGSLDRALTLVDEAARAGAQAIKLQSLYADRLVAASCPPPLHVNVSALRDLFARYELDEAAHAAIAQRARRLGLGFISTPFALDAVDMLHRLGVDAFKIASGDLTHHELIARAAKTGKPLIISTGMSTLRDVADAVACAREAAAVSDSQIALLHCVSAYPVPDDQQNLGAIRTLADTFGVPVGLSDHSASEPGADFESLAIAVTLGASIYERHLKPENGDACLDEAVSSNSTELAAAIAAAARTKRAIGHGRREPQPAEIGNRTPSRRALYAVRDLAPGDIVKAEDIIALRPGDGLSAVHYAALAGTRVSRAIAAGEAFVDADLQTPHPAHSPSPGRGDAPGERGREETPSPRWRGEGRGEGQKSGEIRGAA
jgi:N,N'-diacetyllegionaminate synthase